MNKKLIYENLHKLSFIDTEIDLYIKLLAFGPIGISEFARRSKTPRTTVVENIDRLVKKELVTKQNLAGKTIITAENPIAIKQIVVANIKSLQKELSDLNILLNSTIYVVEKIEKQAATIRSKTIRNEELRALSAGKPSANDVLELESYLKDIGFHTEIAYVINDRGRVHLISEGLAKAYSTNVDSLGNYKGKHIVEIALDPALPIRRCLDPDLMVKFLAIPLLRHRTYSPDLENIDFIERIKSLPGGNEVVNLAKSLDISEILFEENNEISVIVEGKRYRYIHRADIFRASSGYRFGIVTFYNSSKLLSIPPNQLSS